MTTVIQDRRNKTAMNRIQRNQQRKKDGNISKKMTADPMIRSTDTKIWIQTKNSRKTATRMSIHQERQSPVGQHVTPRPMKSCGQKNRLKTVLKIKIAAEAGMHVKIMNLHVRMNLRNGNTL